MHFLFWGIAWELLDATSFPSKLHAAFIIYLIGFSDGLAHVPHYPALLLIPSNPRLGPSAVDSSTVPPALDGSVVSRNGFGNLLCENSAWLRFPCNIAALSSCCGSRPTRTLRDEAGVSCSLCQHTFVLALQTPPCRGYRSFSFDFALRSSTVTPNVA